MGSATRAPIRAKRATVFFMVFSGGGAAKRKSGFQWRYGS
jgi:hypothetical protein